MVETINIFKRYGGQLAGEVVRKADRKRTSLLEQRIRLWTLILIFVVISNLRMVQKKFMAICLKFRPQAISRRAGQSSHFFCAVLLIIQLKIDIFPSIKPKITKSFDSRSFRTHLKLQLFIGWRRSRTMLIKPNTVYSYLFI